MMPKLVVQKGASKGTTLTLPESGAVVIGRDETCTLPLNDSMVSRQHARIELRPDGYHLKDLESLNGTLINAEEIRTARLKVGDVIKIGLSVIAVCADEAAPDPLIGQTLIGRYHILERIGQGGMGACYRARQIDLDRQVAVKVISPHYAKQPGFLDQFIKEARFAAKLNHPNIVSIYEVATAGDCTFYSMELVPGGTVHDLIAQKRRLLPLEAVDITIQIARALEYAHSKEILHRDIKPENMLIGENGQVKLADLGLAQSLGEKIQLANKNHVLGTPHFIAPEIVRNQKFDARSDLYSLGVSMFFMLTGQLPYQAGTMRELITDKITKDAPPVERIVPEIPRSIGGIAAKMLRRNPEERYASASEIVADLELVKRHLSEGTGALKRGLLFGIAAAALIVATIVAIVVASPGGLAPHSSGPDKTDESLALQMLSRAENFKQREMDAASIESIQKAISRFDDVIAKFPGSKYAASAEEQRRDLTRKRNELRAAEELKKVEQKESQAYGEFQESLKSDRPEYEGLESALTAYRRLADDKELGPTRAGATARERAMLIYEWEKAITLLRDQFNRAAENSSLCLIGRRYREADDVWNAFLEKARAAQESVVKSSDERYQDVVYDGRARDEKAKVAQKARDELLREFKDVQESVDQHRFDEASKTLDDAARVFSIGGLDKEIAAKRTEVEAKRREWQKLEDLKKQEAYRRTLATDAVTYQEMSRQLLDRFIGKYDFAGGIKRVIDKKKDAFQTEVYKTRLTERRQQLEQADSFMKAFVNALNASGNPHKLNTSIDLPALRIKGAITTARPDSLELQIAAGAFQSIPFEQLRPQQFHTLVKTIWKINDPSILIALISLCCETGAYDRARDELEALSRNPKFNESKELADFYQRYSRYVALDEVLEAEEIEAEKRFALVNTAFEASDFVLALDALQMLESKLAQTEFVKQNGTLIGQTRTRIQNRLKDSRKEQNFKERLDKLHELALAEDKNALASNPEILARVRKIPDETRRSILLGTIYLYQGQYANSDSMFVAAATRIFERIKRAGDAERVTLYELLLTVYRPMMIDAALLKDQTAFAKNRLELDQIARDIAFTKKEMAEKAQTLRDAYRQTRDALVVWQDRSLPKARETVDRLKEDLERDPFQPDACAALARLCANEIYQYREARSSLAVLLSLFPACDTVRQGEALWSYAEILIGFGEVRKALLLFKDLKDKNKDLPKVKDGTIDTKIRECRELMELLGYSE